jgi:hypothetical protein
MTDLSIAMMIRASFFQTFKPYVLFGRFLLILGREDQLGYLFSFLDCCRIHSSSVLIVCFHKSTRYLVNSGELTDSLSGFQDKPQIYAATFFLSV